MSGWELDIRIFKNFLGTVICNHNLEDLYLDNWFPPLAIIQETEMDEVLQSERDLKHHLNQPLFWRRGH